MGIRNKREKSKAIQIAIKIIRLQMKKIAPEANLGLQGSDLPYHQKCKDEYYEMQKAIEILETMR